MDKPSLSSLQKIETSRCADTYYDICARHPSRSSEQRRPMSGRDIVRQSRDICPVVVAATKGGRMLLAAQRMPAGLELSFILHDGAIEAGIDGTLVGNLSAYRLFCRDAKRSMGKDSPDGLYLDPWAQSIDELLAVTIELRALTLMIAEELTGISFASYQINESPDETIRRWLPTRH